MVSGANNKIVVDNTDLGVRYPEAPVTNGINSHPVPFSQSVSGEPFDEPPFTPISVGLTCELFVGAVLCLVLWVLGMMWIIGLL